MTQRVIVAAGAALGLLAGAAAVQAGETRIHPYAATENHCPAGLQPVTISGVICCGTPTTHVSYQQMMRHPVPKKTVQKVRYSARAHCAEGVKGCD